MKRLSTKLHCNPINLTKQNNLSSWVRKRLAVNFNLIKRNQICVNHVMMIRAKRDEIFDSIRSSVSLGNYMMNRSNVGKSAKNTLATVPYSCSLFSSSVCCSLGCGKFFSKRILPAFLGAICHLLSGQISRGDLHRLPAVLARHLRPVIHWIFTSCQLAAISVPALNGAKFTVLDIRARLKRFFTVPTLVLSIFFPPTLPVVARNKPFTLTGKIPASALT
jgi:hypothetical protein